MKYRKLLSLQIDSQDLTRAADVDNEVEGRMEGPKRMNILVLGKVGAGKARILNGVFQECLFETKNFTPVIRGVSQREKSFLCDGIEFKIKIYDTARDNRSNSKICASRTLSSLKRYVMSLYPQGINLVLLICKLGSNLVEELKELQCYLYHLNKEQVSLISACILNGCVEQSERKNIVTQILHNPETKAIGQYSILGLYAMNFTNPKLLPEEMRAMHMIINRRDADVLKEVVMSCCLHQVTTDSFFASGCCVEAYLKRVPWNWCLCYSSLYKCWRWGYTWDDFMDEDC